MEIVKHENCGEEHLTLNALPSPLMKWCHTAKFLLLVISLKAFHLKLSTSHLVHHQDRERERKKESERWKCFSRIVWHILITISIRHIQHTELLYDEYILNLPNSSHKTILKMNRCGNLIQFWNILQWMPFQSTVWG